MLAIGDDGSARIEFTVTSVSIDTRLEPNGERARWDSAKEKTSGLAGLKKYEALLKAKFTAIVSPEGAIRDLGDAAWPAPEAGGKPGKERDERAAAATHDPTAIRTWLDLIFHSAPEAEAHPDGKDYPARSFTMLGEERLHFHPDGTESVAGYACDKARIHSADKDRVVNPKDVAANATDQEITLQLAKLTRKHGHAWFSPKAGCAVKTELEAATEGVFGTHHYVMKYTWSVELKDRGTAPVTTPGAGTEETK